HAMTERRFKVLRSDRIRAVAALSVVLTIVGCSVADIYERPSVPLPAAFKETGAASETVAWKPAEPSDALARGEWWTIFGDPQLNALQARAAAENQSLKAGLARVEQSRALAGIARADRWPRVE